MKREHDGLLSERLKSSLISNYQTMLGIIQGGGLGFLGITALADYKQFDPMQWWCVVVTFWVLVFTWYTISMDTITWRWIPGLRDAIIPFFIGIYELALIYTATHAASIGVRPWIWLMAVGPGLALLGFWHTINCARAESKHTEPGFKQQIHDLCEPIRRRFKITGVAFAAQLILATASFALPSGTANSSLISWTSVVLVLAACPLASLFIFVGKYWQDVVTYAHVQHYQAQAGGSLKPGRRCKSSVLALARFIWSHLVSDSAYPQTSKFQ